ncbi:hypothetical protein FA15DRAFT_430688 [Coprinopsis marcescibilis]|uniref:BTB domain-containing protein n=1 Tax=Coprinopsis marcescibilis TaxID=230819 RepID=A0A5C3L922_COPMA|nr:hypothetical protein FA15DRAFT_430688 [Coprinopsis marcescibilis]
MIGVNGCTLASSSSSSTAADEQPKLSWVDELWFDDGNLILQAESTLFRVYRGLLTARSSVFRDMFAFPPPPEGNSTMDGCPVIQVYDPAHDMTSFLHAIFDNELPFGGPSFLSADSPIATLESVLRLAHKYDVPFLRRRAMDYLSIYEAKSPVATLESILGLANKYDVRNRVLDHLSTDQTTIAKLKGEEWDWSGYSLLPLSRFTWPQDVVVMILNGSTGATAQGSSFADISGNQHQDTHYTSTSFQGTSSATVANYFYGPVYMTYASPAPSQPGGYPTPPPPPPPPPTTTSTPPPTQPMQSPPTSFTEPSPVPSDVSLPVGDSTIMPSPSTSSSTSSVRRLGSRIGQFFASLAHRVRRRQQSSL